MLNPAWKIHPGQWLADLPRDLRYALRTLRRSPIFTLIAVLTLGLAIGATTTVVKVVDAVLLQPLPLRDSDRVVTVVQHVPPVQPDAKPSVRGFTWRELVQWRERTTTLSDLSGIAPSIAVVKTSQGTARLWGGMTSGGTFGLLDARAMLGRTLIPGDDANPNVVVLSFDTWQRVFQSDPGIVGKPVEFLTEKRGTRAMTVVGVMPADFELPTTARMDFIVPFDLSDESWQTDKRLTLIGRVRAGVTMEAASQETTTLGSAIAQPLPSDALPMALPRFELRSLKEAAVQEVRPALLVLLVAVGVVLLMVCANIASLLLLREIGRQPEIAMRSAIGAHRGRIVRQHLAECLVLAVAGGALGALVAAQGISLVKQLAAVDAPGIFRFSLGASILPRVQEIEVDPKMYGIAFGVTVLAALAFSLVPALRLSRSHVPDALGARGGRIGPGASRLRSLLVVGQVMIATLLLIGAGLLVHSFVKLVIVDRGYNPANAIVFQLVFPPDYPIARKTGTLEKLLTALRAAPDVKAVGFTHHGLFVQEPITIGVFVPKGRTLEEMSALPHPSLRTVSGGYLSAVRGRMIEGADLNPLDSGTPPAIVISRSTARMFGRGRQIARFVEWHWGKHVVPLQVVGVVADLRNTTPEVEPIPEVFIDYREVLKIQQQLKESPALQDERALGLFSLAVRMDPETVPELAPAVTMVSRIVREVDRERGRRRHPAARSPRLQLARAFTLPCRAAWPDRGLRGSARGDWHLRRARLRRGTAEARDRNPQGAGRAAQAGAVAHPAKRPGPDDARPDPRSSGRGVEHAFSPGHVVRGRAARSHHVRGRVSAVPSRRAFRLLSARATGGTHRSSGRAQNGVSALALPRALALQWCQRAGRIQSAERAVPTRRQSNRRIRTFFQPDSCGLQACDERRFVCPMRFRSRLVQTSTSTASLRRICSAPAAPARVRLSMNGPVTGSRR